MTLRTVSTRLVPALALAVLSLLSVTGCAQSASDRHTFYSTPTQPTSIAVIDALSNEPIWSYDIPVGQKLMLNLNEEAGSEDSMVRARQAGVYPSELVYEVYPIDKSSTWENYYNGSTLDEGSVMLPGTPVSVVVAYRPGPEMPVGQPNVDLSDDGEDLPMPEGIDLEDDGEPLPVPAEEEGM